MFEVEEENPSNDRIKNMIENGNNKVLNDIGKELDARGFTKERRTGSKVSRILDSADEGNNINCPTCGHNHSLKQTGNNRLKCTGSDCGEEYALISTNSNYYCKDCKTPHSRPKNKEDEANDSCPMCGGNEFIKAEKGDINYKKIREKVAKKQKK